MQALLKSFECLLKMFRITPFIFSIKILRQVILVTSLTAFQNKSGLLLAAAVLKDSAPTAQQPTIDVRYIIFLLDKEMISFYRRNQIDLFHP